MEKIFRTFKEVFGMIGYSKIEIFLINSRDTKTIVFVSLELIRKISILLYPIIPNTSLKVLNIFSIKEKDIKFDTIINNEYLKDKKEIIKLGILFEKIKK